MSLLNLNHRKGQRLSSLVGLALEGNRLEVSALRRTNGGLQMQQSFSVALSLDPLTNDPELVGREIRNHLEAAGVRQKYCVLGLPLKWALMLHTKIPDLPEADVESYLQIEAERGFPCDVATLQVASARYRSPEGEQFATFLGIPRNHLAILEQVLRAAQLKPVSFSLGITALQPSGTDAAAGVLALAIGESLVGMQIICHGGVAALRALEGGIEMQGGRPQLNPELVAREARITLGQLPAEFRDTVRRIRIFGLREPAQELAEELRSRFEPLGLKIEVISAYTPADFGLQLPPGVGVSESFSLAARQLAGRPAAYEFLPPKVTAWQKLATRYSSGTLQRAGIAAGFLLLMLGCLFSFQQWQLWHLGSKWTAIGPKVRELEGLQANIKQFRPWFDDSIRTLRILRQLTDAFPEDGVVSAKNVEIHEFTVACSGVARDNGALLRTMERLRAAPPVSDLQAGPIRGKAPMQFKFEFRWNDGREK